MFKLMERGGGHRAPAGHGGVRNRTRTSAWQTDCPSGSRAEGRGVDGGTAEFAALRKLSKAVTVLVKILLFNRRPLPFRRSH